MQTVELIQKSGIGNNSYLVAWIIGILVGIIAFLVGGIWFLGGKYINAILGQLKTDQQQIGKDVHTAITAYQGVLDESLDAIKLRLQKSEDNIEELFIEKNKHAERITTVEIDVKHIQK